VDALSPTLLIGIGLAGAAGFLILLIVGLNMWREERAGKAEAKPDEAAAPEDRPSEPAAPSPLRSLFARAASGGAPASTHEVLRVSRDNLTGRLSVDIAGKHYASFSEVQDPNIARGLLTTVQDLQAFVGSAAPAQPASPPPMTGAAETPAPAIPPQPPAATEAPPAPPATPPPRPEPTQPAPAAAKPITRSSELPPIRVPSMNPFKQAQILRELSKNPPPALKTIPEQIDDFLQERILGTPLVRRGVHVRAGPNGDIVFDVEGKAYTSVGEVPDPDIQAVIRDAIAEWEKTQ
jgi:hypothetical protein